MNKSNLTDIENDNLVADKGTDKQLLNIAKVSNKRFKDIQKTESMLSSFTDMQLISGFPPLPDLNLKFKGGKTISNMYFVNFYLDNSNSWNQNDIKSIDFALDGAMSDKNLNNVIIQYYPGRDKINSTFKGSELLQGVYPERLFKDDVHSLVIDLYKQKKLDNYDLENTVFNFILPSGTMLNSNFKNAIISSQQKLDNELEEKADSSEGLGGFHGSVHIPENNDIKIYYAVGVYSQKFSNGTRNGIVAFDKPWKNVVATFYHELIEARTDPDVGDAIANNDNSLLGWYTDNQEIPVGSNNKIGGEIGDIPIRIVETFANGDLSKIFKEVPLANGSGLVPIQLQYSNAVNGIEGPISSPHALSSQ